MTEQTEPMIPEMTEEAPKRKRGRPKASSLEPGPSGSESSGKLPRGLERQISEIEIGLIALFKGAGGIISYFDQFDGSIISGSNPLSTMPLFVDAVCRAAKSDARLRAWLLTVVHVSAYSDIAMYAAMMLVPILLHHNIIPMGLFTSSYDDTSTDNSTDQVDSTFRQNGAR